VPVKEGLNSTEYTRIYVRAPAGTPGLCSAANLRSAPPHS
jgi:hypothetical protein